MQERASQLPNKLRDLIVSSVREMLGTTRPYDLYVNSGFDHDGDAAIFVDIKFGMTDQPIDPAIFPALAVSIREKLLGKGEDRFPYIRYKFAEQQKVVGFK